MGQMTPSVFADREMRAAVRAAEFGDQNGAASTAHRPFEFAPAQHDWAGPRR